MIKQHLIRNAPTYIVSVPTILCWIIVAYWGESTWKEGVKIVFPALAILLTIAFFILILVNFVKKIVKMTVSEVVKDGDYHLSGAILYKEGVPHISLRVKTIHTIFSKILDITTCNDQILVELGKCVGDNFIENSWRTMDFAVNFKVDNNQMTPKQKLVKWMDMEKTAGWGEFQISFFQEQSCGRFSGEIKVKNCFLTSERTLSHKSFCPFLVGYCRAIITGLTGFEVEVREDYCSRDPNNSVCAFSFNPVL